MSKLMTLDEKLSISNKAAELWKAGDKEGADLLAKTIPIPPYIANVIKDKLGLDFLLKGGWNLSEVEAEYGHSFFNK